MNYSLKYIRKLANLIPTISDETILEALNNLGFEVEHTSIFVDGKKLVIGTIENIKPHPDAHRLNILKVNVGVKNIQIVTGASNIEVKKQVIVCLPGATCNGVQYETLKLRGIESNGMLASLSELGISSKYLPDSLKEEIQLLEPIYINGTNALKVLNLDDLIVNIDLLSNRGDAHGYYFIAIELSAYFNTKINWNIFDKSTSTYESNLVVNNGLANHMTFFEAEALKGESNFSKKLMLIKSNIIPVNKTVDLTNMALLLFGQAVHAYDKDKIGKTFNCQLYSGKLITINNNKIELKNNLVIFNDNKPVSIAGVIGLNNSMITNDTKKVVFEVASFNPKYIRNTSKQTKIENITVIRNSKFSSLNIIPIVINYLSNFLKNPSCPVNNYKSRQEIIKVTLKDINDYAGFTLTECDKYETSQNFLRKIGYKISEDKYTVPFYRYDVHNQYDVIEDLFRGYGFNNIPEIQSSLFSSIISKTDHIKTSLANQDYSEIITYSLHEESYNDFNPFQIRRKIKLKNSLSLKRIIYKHTLIRSMADVAIKNIKYKINKFSLFEIGYINGYLKEKHLGLISTIKDIDEIKTNIASILNISQKLEFKRTKYKHLHEGISADIYLEEKYIGFVGKFRPTYLKTEFWIAEIKLSNPTKKQENNIIKYSQLITRDVTFNLKTREDVAPYINKLRAIIDIKFIDYIETFNKNDEERAETFKIYLDKKNSELFDKHY